MQRLFGGGSGLDGLLNPHISPSVGLHFGGYPYGYGYYGGHYRGSGGGYRSPFQFDLGPFSINPFGGLRFSIHNGRPHIRPTLDLLVTPNRNEFHNRPSYPPLYDPYYPYHNRHIRDVRYPIVNEFPLVGRKIKSFSPALEKKSSPIKPSLPLQSALSGNYKTSTFIPPPQKTQHHSRVTFPVEKKVVFPNKSLQKPKNLTSHHVPPLLGFGKSNVHLDSVRNDREDIYTRGSR